MSIRFQHLIILLVFCSFPFCTSAQFKQVSSFDSPIINLFTYRNKIWANTLSNGLYVADSSPQVWQKRWTLSYDSTLNQTRKYTTVINQIIPYGDSLYASTAAGIFTSSDEGIHWTRLKQFLFFDPYYNSLRDLSIKQIAFSPTAIIALLENGTKTAISTDNGRSWSDPFPTQLPNGTVLPYDQFRAIRWISNRWYLLTSQALFTSNDNGVSWQATSLTATNDTFSSLAADGNTLLVGASTPSVYRSGAYDFTINLYVSSNAGVNWNMQTFYSQAPKYLETSPVNVTINDGRLYASSLGGVWHSQVNNLQWNLWNEGVSYRQEQGYTANPDLWSEYSEAAIAVLDNQLFCPFTIEGGSSYPIKGNLFIRSLTEISPTYTNAPILPWVKETTDDYNLIRWKDYSVGETSFRIERADLATPEAFQEIGTVAPDSIQFKDRQINHSMNYIYRIRTEKNGTYSTYSPTVRTYRYTNCSQVKDISVPRLLSQPSPTIIYALAGSELIKSTNTGRDWQELNTCYGNELTYVDLQFRSVTEGVVLAKSASTPVILLKTSDGGENWAMILPKLPDSRLEATRVYFLSNSTGYLIAKTNSVDESTIYKTTDGGLTYTQLPNSPTLYNRVVFSDQNIIAGIARTGQSSNFELRLSTDGGQSWAYRPIPYSGVSRLVIVDTANFWMLSSPYGSNKTLFRTVNAGRSWQKVTLPRPAADTTSFNNYWEFSPFQDIVFIDKSVGFVVGGRPRTVANDFTVTPQKVYLFKTVDGGSTWTEVPLATPAEIILTTISFNGMKGILTGISLYDAKEAAQLGRIPGSRYIYTTDNLGTDWTLTCQLDNMFPQSVAYRTPEEGYLIGLTFDFDRPLSTNCYYKTSDGGISWKKIVLPAGEHTWEVYFLNTTTGFITTRNSVWTTVDGGLSWNQKSTSIQLFQTRFDGDYIQSYDYNRSYFLGPTSWIRVSYANKIYRTDDAGNSWTLLPTANFTGVPKVSFVTPELGFITGKEGNLSGQIYRTTNGGQSWMLLSHAISVASDIATRLKFISPTVGFVYDYATHITRDGGKTWRTMSNLPSGLANGSDMFFLDSLTGYNTNTLRTSDGGNTWFASGLDQHVMWPFTVADNNIAYGYNYKVRLGTPPCSIIAPSLSVTYCVGNTITLSTFSIYNPQYRYQWYKNDASSPVVGQNTSTLSIVNSKATDAGMYFCITSNDCGAASNTPASLKSALYIYSIQEGDWTSRYTWSCDREPISSDAVQLNHRIYIPYYKEAKAHQIQLNLGGRLDYGYGAKLKIFN